MFVEPGNQLELLRTEMKATLEQAKKVFDAEQDAKRRAKKMEQFGAKLRELDTRMIEAKQK